MGFRRREEPGTVDDEREALRQQRLALEELKAQLAERVEAVHERERELQRAIIDVQRGEGGTAPPARAEPFRLPPPEDGTLAARVAALDRKEQELSERELVLQDAEDAAQDQLEQRALALEEREAAVAARERELARPPLPPDEARLKEIEARLIEVKEAERLFMRTRAELAARSEAVAARERLATQRERELDEREDGESPARPQIGELEARLRRLEQQQPGEQTEGFSGGFKKLQQQGTRPRNR